MKNQTKAESLIKTPFEWLCCELDDIDKAEDSGDLRATANLITGECVACLRYNLITKDEFDRLQTSIDAHVNDWLLFFE